MTSREAPEHLWKKLASADEEVSFVAFEELVLHYQYLVEAIARKLEHRLPSYLEDDELLSLGQIGLLKALGKYDSEQGAFSKYASAVIWGAIIDGLRANDFAPPRVEEAATRPGHGSSGVEGERRHRPHTG